MKKQQVILLTAGLLLLAGLFFFGQTVPPKKKNSVIAGPNSVRSISFVDINTTAKAKLTPSQSSYVNRLENSVVRGDVKNQQLKAYQSLASFWKDSSSEGFLPFAHYTGEAAKLESSEKSLTFAAQLFLENLQQQDDGVLKTWMADQAKDLYVRALDVNPANDSSKVGLGACFIFGSSSANPQEVMQGIQRILEVARRDSMNMYAQFMLGMGGLASGQVDKAIERLTRVVHYQPGNIEAVLTLAEANQQKGNKEEAIRWYQQGRKLIANPAVVNEIDKRIKQLK